MFLNLDFRPPSDHSTRLPSDTGSGPNDSFLVALHQILQSPNLTDVSLGTRTNYKNNCSGLRISADLFWPHDEPPEMQVSFFPRLQYIDVAVNEIGPGGRWITTGKKFGARGPVDEPWKGKDVSPQD